MLASIPLMIACRWSHSLIGLTGYGSQAAQSLWQFKSADVCLFYYATVQNLGLAGGPSARISGRLLHGLLTPRAVFHAARTRWLTRVVIEVFFMTLYQVWVLLSHLGPAQQPGTWQGVHKPF